ncbi:protein kinase domain-containing protein [Rosistilla oblonga]|uniref:Tubulin-like protein n=1 Tax=Rosistilla oblonga TaxID=2527990 RepID=A0A518IPH9_9BACT|nr:tubulin-like doman-containing protein [Rosistilla oblonga]QDV55005.1 Tubulin-like protein [Rosistilla oblonga]
MTISALKIESGTETIAGYKVLRKLGAGGYGEVWSAEAPGGMEKAIKFVFGSHDSERGSRELRSLNRIKGVNHPFLLSLERFEIINGQLIIVTELAAGSLEDIYNKHRERGSCGIPKPDLLGYLHDAADGLDYLHDEFQLQHLDVKPGNLLIVGGHVKVGDFGLLKDLGDIECSMVGGLTPIYAAPEVFDGRPHHNSDQYSLAVMYQEMLTGHRPFAGRTIAQLATQHVHSAPNLESLPPADRPVIARALEKDPNRRFPSCRDLVNRLKQSSERPIAIPTQANPVDGNTQRFDELSESLSVSNRPAVANLPRLDSKELSSLETSEALVIGLGGVGRSVMEQLCLKQTNSESTFCNLQGLLIDTDDAELYRFREFEIANNLICNVQRACFPLKSPHDYRESHGDRFTSISRRWIYNVPKTRRTEGLRPLGRLALIDHASHLKRMLSQSISELQNDPDGNRKPRIYVVGSLYGGTASGMFLDVTFMLRNLLDEHSLAEIEVRPLMLASVPEDVANADPLSIASTHAALSEMHYFLQPNKGYPEDRANTLASVPAARTPLPAAYVAAPSKDQDGIQLLSDYLWNDAFIAPALMDQARKRPEVENENRTDATLRSFGSAPLEVRPQIDLEGLQKRSIDQVIRGWMGDPKTQHANLRHDVISTLNQIGVSPTLWAAQQIEEVLQQKPETWCTELEQTIAREMKSRRDPSAPIAKDAVICARAKVQPLLAMAAESDEPTQELPQLGKGSIGSLMQLLRKKLRDQKLDLFQSVGLLRAITKQCFAYAQENEHEITSLRERANDALHLAMSDLTSTRVKQIDLSRISGAMLDLMRADLQKPNGIVFEEIGDQVKCLEQELLSHANELADLHQLLLGLQLPSGLSSNLTERKIQPVVAAALHDQFADKLLFRCLSPSAPVSPPKIGDMLDQMMASAAETANEMLNDTSGAGVVSSEELKSLIDTALKRARPKLLRFGGRQRVLLVGDDKRQLASLKPAIEAAVGCEITTLVAPNAKTMILHEASEIPVASILGNLVGTLGADLTIAGRLMSRCDIQWTEPTESNSTAKSMTFAN